MSALLEKELKKFKWNPVEKFPVTIDGKDMMMTIEPDGIGRGWYAYVNLYDGFQVHSTVSREDALFMLVERIEQAIIEERI